MTLSKSLNRFVLFNLILACALQIQAQEPPPPPTPPPPPEKENPHFPCTVTVENPKKPEKFTLGEFAETDKMDNEKWKKHFEKIFKGSIYYEPLEEASSESVDLNKELEGKLVFKCENSIKAELTADKLKEYIVKNQKTRLSTGAEALQADELFFFDAYDDKTITVTEGDVCQEEQPTASFTVGISAPRKTITPPVAFTPGQVDGDSRKWSTQLTKLISDKNLGQMANLQMTTASQNQITGTFFLVKIPPTNEQLQNLFAKKQIEKFNTEPDMLFNFRGDTRFKVSCKGAPKQDSSSNSASGLHGGLLIPSAICALMVML